MGRTATGQKHRSGGAGKDKSPCRSRSLCSGKSKDASCLGWTEARERWWENEDHIMRSLEGHGLNLTLVKTGSSEKFCTRGILSYTFKKADFDFCVENKSHNRQERSGEDIQEATPGIQRAADRGRGGAGKKGADSGHTVGFADRVEGGLIERQNSRMSKNLKIWRSASSK